MHDNTYWHLLTRPTNTNNSRLDDWKETEEETRLKITKTQAMMLNTMLPILLSIIMFRFTESTAYY